MYAGIDCGTQGTKVVIYDDRSGQIIAQGYAKHELISDDDGTREQHPDWWIEALIAAFGSALEAARLSPDAIEGIGVSGQMVGLVVLDGGYNVLRPCIMWNDQRSVNEAEELTERIGLEFILEEEGYEAVTACECPTLEECARAIRR